MTKTSYNKLFITLLALLIVTTGFSQEISDQVYKFSRVLHKIDNYYVDSIDREELVETAIISMLKELDQHSVYLSQDEVQETNESLQGNFEGIGISYNIIRDTLIVISAISGGPSEKLGIKAGDRIVKIAEKNIANAKISNEYIRKNLRGEKGSKVWVSIKRPGISELLEFEITRDKIPIHSVESSYMINKDVGYIRLSRFSANTMQEFDRAFKKLKRKNVKDLVLDLQQNGGGYLNVAIELADEFLEKDKLVVYTEGRNNPKFEYKATNKGSFDEGRLIILIDEGSASASEIVSGALQDWDRGLVIGRRSFGKGLVQRPFSLRDGSAIRLTIARYYTPTGRLIQKPYDEGVKEYRNEIRHRILNGELSTADSIHFPDSLKYLTLNMQREVYGGGGIMPDIFVPIDTSMYSDYFRDVIRKGILNDYITDYMDDNRKYFTKKLKKFDKFNENFVVDDIILSDFKTKSYTKLNEEILTQLKETENFMDDDVSASEKHKELQIQLDSITNVYDSEFETSKSLIANRIKAIIARDLWSSSEYFEITNQVNPAFLKAVEVLNENKEYQAKLNY